MLKLAALLVAFDGVHSLTFKPGAAPALDVGLSQTIESTHTAAMAKQNWTKETTTTAQQWDNAVMVASAASEWTKCNQPGCSEAVWNTFANHGTCGEQISYVKSHHANTTWPQACAQIAAQSYTPECSPCGPSSPPPPPAPPPTWTFCEQSKCTEEVWNTYVSSTGGKGTCGDHISFVQASNHSTGNWVDACTLVGTSSYTPECKLCAPSWTWCEQPTCTKEVWYTPAPSDNGPFTCGEQIEHMVWNEGSSSWFDACQHVAAQSWTPQCRACARNDLWMECKQPSCTEEVWNTEASNGEGTCGQQISHVLVQGNASEQSWVNACTTVATQPSTPECSPCGTYPPAAPPPPVWSMCEVPSCTEEVWNTKAYSKHGNFTCGQQIEYRKAQQLDDESWVDACTKVGTQSWTPECLPCSRTDLWEQCRMPGCTEEVWNTQASNKNGTCGEQIANVLHYVMWKEPSESWLNACTSVGVQPWTPECQPCASYPPPPPSSPPPPTWTHCEQPGCSEAVWNTATAVGDGTCGEQISYVYKQQGSNASWVDACSLVGLQLWTSECQPCATYSPPPPAAPPPPTWSLCEQPDCSEAVWNTFANHGTCGEQISYVKSQDANMTWPQACAQIAAQSYTPECSPCGPSSPPPPPSSGTRARAALFV